MGSVSLREVIEKMKLGNPTPEIDVTERPHHAAGIILTVRHCR